MMKSVMKQCETDTYSIFPWPSNMLIQTIPYAMDVWKYRGIKASPECII